MTCECYPVSQKQHAAKGCKLKKQHFNKSRHTLNAPETKFIINRHHLHVYTLHFVTSCSWEHALFSLLPNLNF